VIDPIYELLWVQVGHAHDLTFVGALYHPPSPMYKTSDILIYTDTTVLQIQNSYPQLHIILAGDFNLLPESEVIIRTGFMSVIFQPTRGDRYLDRVYVSDIYYSNLKVVKSAVKSDHMAIVARTISASIM